jgi:hypothetical protein
MDDTPSLPHLLDETARRQNLVVWMRCEDKQTSIAVDDERRRECRPQAAAVACDAP